MSKKLTTVIFIERSIKKHGLKYDYSDSEYIGRAKGVEILCLEHGSFWQHAGSHMDGAGCPKCYKRIHRLTPKKEVLKRFYNKHGIKYDYSDTIFKKMKSRVKIICPTHGSFWQTPECHIRGQGCPECASSGFKKDLPAILYYFKDTVTGLYKIGITNKKFKERFSGKLKEIELIKTWDFNVGLDAYNKEQSILLEYDNLRLTNENFKGFGATEFFSENIINEIKEIL